MLNPRGALSLLALTTSIALPSIAAGQSEYAGLKRNIEVRVAEVRLREIRDLEALLELDDAAKDIASVQFRLADAYYEQSRSHFLKSEEATSQRAREEHLRGQSEWENKAQALYGQILDRHPKYERRPEVLVALAQIHWSHDRYDQAVELYGQLIVEHPKSPLVQDAWFAVGEVYFERGDISRALEAYKRAAKDNRSEVYGYALYKQGWCYYNKSDWTRAMHLFRTVAKLGLPTTLPSTPNADRPTPS